MLYVETAGFLLHIILLQGSWFVEKG